MGNSKWNIIVKQEWQWHHTYSAAGNHHAPTLPSPTNQRLRPWQPPCYQAQPGNYHATKPHLATTATKPNLATTTLPSPTWQHHATKPNLATTMLPSPTWQLPRYQATPGNNPAAIKKQRLPRHRSQLPLCNCYLWPQRHLAPNGAKPKLRLSDSLGNWTLSLNDPGQSGCPIIWRNYSWMETVHYSKWCLNFLSTSTK